MAIQAGKGALGRPHFNKLFFTLRSRMMISFRDHMSAIANGQEEAAAILRTGVRKTKSNDSRQLNQQPLRATILKSEWDRCRALSAGIPSSYRV
jgi:hypothetical protein